jgi:hypothetical protein
MLVMDLGVFAFCYTRECVVIIRLERGAHRDPSYDVPVELFGPLAGQSVGDLFDILVASTREALYGWNTTNSAVECVYGCTLSDSP